MPLFTHILALATVALVALSSFPANALAADHARAARHIHGHNAVAKHRRDASSSSTCRPRPTTSLATPSSTPTPTPTSSTASSTAPSQTASSSGGFARKMGLAWAEDDTYLPNFALPNVGFFHNWSPHLPTTQLEQLGIEGIALLWGKQNITDFKTTVVAGYAKYAGALNEPDQVGQANMDPADAAQLWVEVMNPIKELGYTLHGPCCTDSPDAQTWYLQFEGNCTILGGCSIDWWCVHAYNTNVTEVFVYLEWLHDTFGHPVIVTEVGDQDYSGANQQPTSLDQVIDFATALRNFTLNTAWMVGLAPYGVMDKLNIDELNQLIDPNTHEPTQLAYTYYG